MDADTRFFMGRGAYPGMKNCPEHHHGDTEHTAISEGTPPPLLRPSSP